MLHIGYFFMFPFAASAGAANVQINEIAWMGTHSSADYEWIELRSDGDTAADLSGWTLSAADGSPQIALTGGIAPKGYFLLERSSDETVSGVTADQIYSGALSNSGETLTLRNAEGVLVDTVESGADWENIGGDNITKQTAQRTSSAQTWMTATGTPKRVNVSGGEVASAATPNEKNDVQVVSTAQAGGVVNVAGGQTGAVASAASIYPRKGISVFAGDDVHIFSGFPIIFSGSAKGLYDEELEYATYRWNFGDGGSASGKNVTHSYAFAGEYVVVLEAVWGPHKKTDRMIVVVSQPDISITRAKSGADGFVEVANHTNREIDLSGWALRASTTQKSFLFPDNTILLPRKSAVFSNEMTQIYDEGAISLLSPSGAVVYQHGEPSSVTLHAVGTVKGAATLKSTSPVSPPKQTDPNRLTAREKATEDSQLMASTAAATILWERSGEVPLQTQIFSRGMKWFYALAGILLVALAGFIIARSRDDEASIANEYAIIEDIIEGEIKE